MEFRLPTREEISRLERFLKESHTSQTAYAPLRENLAHYSYSTAPAYAEWVFFKSREPTVRDVASFVIGSDTLGLSFVRGNEIWMNPDERHAGMVYGRTLRHEKDHDHTPFYIFTYGDERRRENERMNRQRTESETGDATQMYGFR